MTYKSDGNVGCSNSGDNNDANVVIAGKVRTRRTTVMLTVVLMIGRSTGMLLLTMN